MPFDLSTAKPVSSGFDLSTATPVQATQAPQRSTGEEVGRQLGLAGRYAVEGAAALPGALANVPAYAMNKILDAAEHLSGRKIDYRFPDQNQNISNALTSAGLPQPENTTERLVGDASRAVAGAGSGIGMAQPLANASGQVARGVGQQLIARPAMQAVSSASGATAGGVVRENGGGPLAQFAANVVGGMAPFVVGEGAKAIARGARALVEPFTESGRGQIVGRALNDSATNPQAAQQNMANASEVVPGSQPTAADVSKDYGIIATERAAKAQNPAAFAARESDQNAARQQYISVAAKDQLALNQAIARRDAVTAPLRNKAFQDAQGKTVDTAALTSKIDQLIANPDNAGSRTQQALNWVKEQVADKTDPRALYAVRKELSDVIAGKVDSEKSFLRYTAGELRDVRGFIDDAIGDIAPTWKDYLTKYRQLSRPIDRMTLLQDAQNKSALAVSDARTGYEVLSQAKWKTQVKNLLESGSLTSGQQERVRRVAEDLNRGMAINDPNIRAIGSNTTQDMTAANLLGQMLGSNKMAPFVRSVARPFQWIYKVPEQEIRGLLTESLLDPKMGAELMKNASGAQMQKVSALLRQRFVASAIGTSEAGATQKQSVPESMPVQGQ